MCYVCVSVCLCLHVSVCVSMYYVCVFVSVHRCLHVSMRVSVCVSMCRVCASFTQGGWVMETSRESDFQVLGIG